MRHVVPNKQLRSASSTGGRLVATTAADHRAAGRKNDRMSGRPNDDNFVRRLPLQSPGRFSTSEQCGQCVPRQHIRLPPRSTVRPRDLTSARPSSAEASISTRGRRTRTVRLTRENPSIQPSNTRPWMILAAAPLCIILTFLLKIGGNALETHRISPQPAQLGTSPVGAPKETRIAPLNAGRSVGRMARAPADKKTQISLIDPEEVDGFNLGRGPIQRQTDPEQGDHNADLGDPHRLLGQDEVFKHDPQTGAWFAPSGRWRVSGEYHLPIDGREIYLARQNLSAIQIKPTIELEWWYPREVQVAAKHWKGKIAKLRFLAVMRLAQMLQAEDYLRNIDVRGTNSDGSLLIQADAIFYSSGWNLVSTAVEEKPEWFPRNGKSIKRGKPGRLPATGRDIELVRKAVHEEEQGGRIREVKWWKPRISRAIRHRLSKLRYEVNRDGDVRTEEVVFDYNQLKITYRRQPDNVFLESDRRALGLQPARSSMF